MLHRASENRIKQLRKKYHQLHKQHLHSDRAFKPVKRTHQEAGRAETDQKHCVWAVFVIELREANTPFWIVTAVLFREAKLDSVSYSSPSHL